MEITGKVIELVLNTQVPKKDGGSYPGVRLTFRDSRDDKIKEKGFHQAVLSKTPALKNGLDNLSNGDDFTALAEKDGEFWNWKSIIKGIVSISPSQGSQVGVVSKAPSTYATVEERAQTQTYIIRQSSITAALKLAELNKDTPTAYDIITLAEVFESWVMGIPKKQEKDFSDLESDII